LPAVERIRLAMSVILQGAGLGPSKNMGDAGHEPIAKSVLNHACAPMGMNESARFSDDGGMQRWPAWLRAQQDDRTRGRCGAWHQDRRSSAQKILFNLAARGISNTNLARDTFYQSRTIGSHTCNARSSEEWCTQPVSGNRDGL
jgi:hypothetical protein